MELDEVSLYEAGQPPEDHHVNSRDPVDRPEVTEGKPPFALCINDVPIARVPFDTAIDHAAAALEQIRRTVPDVSRTFSVGLCRLGVRAMEDLPAARPTLVAAAVARIMKQKLAGEVR